MIVWPDLEHERKSTHHLENFLCAACMLLSGLFSLPGTDHVPPRNTGVTKLYIFFWKLRYFEPGVNSESSIH